MYKVKVENLKQFEIVLASKNVSEIILARDSFVEKDLPKLVEGIKKSNKVAWILMERISRYEENMKSHDLRLATDKIYEINNLGGVIIQNLDSFAYMLRKINKASNEKLKVELNYTMNCYNLETKKVFTELYNKRRENSSEVPLLFTAPVELNIYELSDVKYDTFLLYSYVDTMVTANCLRKNTGGKDICKCKFNFEKNDNFSSYILDRKNKKLHYKVYCKYCYNKIFNVEPLYLIDKVNEIRFEDALTGTADIERAHYRIDFSFENEKEVRDILNKKVPDSFTRGHIKNSIK